MNTKYKKIFFQEADEKIADLNASLLEFEKNQNNSKSVNEAMRAAHTLKSSSVAMGYEKISLLAHEMEDLFELVRQENKTLSADAVEVLFAATDALQFTLESLKSGEEAGASGAILERVHARIKKIRDEDEQNTKTKEQSTQDGSALDRKDTEKVVKGNIEAIEQSAQDGSVSGEKNIETANHTDESNIHLKSIDAIKVDIHTLDTLMNLTEELLVENMRLAEVVRTVKEDPSSPAPLELLSGSKDAFNRLVSELQYHVTQARMLPLGQVFERFPRLVRDLSKKVGKNIEFSMIGQDIELDRTVIDRLGEPLIHLVRNAVDHGVDSKGTVRIHAARMKDTVIIDVENTGKSINWKNVVNAAISRQILSAEKGKDYLQKLEADRTGSSDEALFRLQNKLKHILFHPQLSTNDTVTETSGRGVGLHIVKTVVESFGGTVSVESPVEGSNDGTKFTLRLPLTLAIIQAMLVRISEQTFAIPFTQIDRTVRITAGQIKKAFDQEVAVVEEEDVPLVRLAERFQISDFRFQNDEKTKKQTEKKLKKKTNKETEVVEENLKSKIINLKSSELMLITKPGAMPVAGLIVDELISEQDIVVKPLKGVLQRTKGFAGITLLGDGKPALILDVATLI
jgi:two-component system, chemotaxis family, sensor kinase CheA